ncbi:SHOCT domain-containing protein [Alicyclobacillus fastidiosus]|uniref:SHOCT domain-containing protein n=1 Tax=Alicyclobacillus fastidiosus TaxID=392011 RepID=A0ABV5AGK3_9BACL|nr:SHOCT domain-containing protein [Alicyclobacillus fastidiosus]WEH07954.1 SHOCT domain-containing protein [Alicyclobacillus fastidiosus]
MWWGHGFGCFGFFIFLAIFICFIVTRVCMFRRYGGCGRRWMDDAEAILRRRLASGEIDEAEYQKLRDALKR